MIIDSTFINLSQNLNIDLSTTKATYQSGGEKNKNHTLCISLTTLEEFLTKSRFDEQYFFSKIISHKSKKNVIMLCLSQDSLIFCHQMPMVSVTVSIEQNIPRDAIKTYL